MDFGPNQRVVPESIDRDQSRLCEFPIGECSKIIFVGNNIGMKLTP